ncbi:hypothetical protein BJ138DRAFT_1141204 [Hygrophoropsis aurantiaca]|uniref:Uncharacterized protein n=1 Tax=Hygrophoropsis aurantiaca TaxID=72124 RepID=A0ACB8AS36_9AGAM|nr:hypothetical protein BJ138DRAFT_1141204 [Hygrophoropsis aurantiaca]
MALLYGPSDIAAANDLQRINYVYVSVAVVWATDYVLQLGNEVVFLWSTRWGKTKILYCLARYIPFILIGMNLFQSLKPNLDPKMCHPLYEVGAGLSGLSLVCSECIFFLRTYAIWGRNRKVLVVLTSSLVALVVAVIVVLFTYQSSIKFVTPPVPVITGCYRTGQDNVLFIAYLLLLVFELEVLAFTLFKAVKQYRQAHNQLLQILIQHNIFYFGCGFVFSVANILCLTLLQGSNSDIISSSELQTAMHAILVTRMHLHLWEQAGISSPPQTADFDLIPMTNMEFAEVPAVSGTGI